MDQATVDALRTAIEVEFGRNAPPEGFPNLPRIPVGRYIDPEFFKLERERVFDRSWLFVGTMWDFPEAGSFKVFDNMGRAQVLLVRGEDDKIRAFYNTCRHRGATIIRDECGTAKGGRFSCQFHAWTYDLEGKLVGIPDKRDFSNDPSLDDEKLHSIRCEIWCGFIFINLSDDAPDLLTWLGPVAEDFNWVDGLRPSHRRERLLACNWRVCIEAFIEVYHIATVHPTTVGAGLNHRGTVSNFYTTGHSRMIVPNPDWHDSNKAIPVNGHHPDEGRSFRSEVSVSYNLFPNLLAPAGQTGFTLMEFWPADVNHTRLVTSTVQPDDHPEDERKAAQDYFDVIMDEDTWNMEHIQHSYQSPSFEGPKIGVHEKRLYFLEQSIDRMIGRENVPEHLRVEPLLEKYIVDTPQAV
ncbi:MAG: aromatic ring-hydroxylating dioxygenase subunit alpha [Proteobacteria bacterium]|nr:aromatic ring-hydroxylating dioxygenase subunit alpha [Pseudomonadota bacterium]